jgi:hypothetical protein
MQRDDFINLLNSKNYTSELDGDTLKITHQGNVDLRSLKTLPENTAFNNQGNVDLRSLKTLPENTAFNNQGNVDLRSLKTLPENTAFNNQGHVRLPSLTTLPENTAFNNQGYVYLRSLTTLPTLYRSKKRLFRTVDGMTMIIKSSKKVGEFSVASALYFGGGDVAKLRPCFIASSDSLTSHGETIEAAIRDLRFKIAQVNYDDSDLIERVKSTGIITRNDFRLLTGACESGLKHGLEEMGLPPNLEQMTVKEAIQRSSGKYGGDKIRAAFSN